MTTMVTMTTTMLMYQKTIDKISRPDFCPPSALQQTHNKDLLLSWLPVVSPVGRPTAGYRVPAAPTRYLSTHNTLLDGDHQGVDEIEEL